MRPVLLNSWEAMYYDVTLEKIEKQADLAKQLGIELFVLDDGWSEVEMTAALQWETGYVMKRNCREESIQLRI